MNTFLSANPRESSRMWKHCEKFAKIGVIRGLKSLQNLNRKLLHRPPPARRTQQSLSPANPPSSWRTGSSAIDGSGTSQSLWYGGGYYHHTKAERSAMGHPEMYPVVCASIPCACGAGFSTTRVISFTKTAKQRERLLRDPPFYPMCFLDKTDQVTWKCADFSSDSDSQTNVTFSATTW